MFLAALSGPSRTSLSAKVPSGPVVTLTGAVDGKVLPAGIDTAAFAIGSWLLALRTVPTIDAVHCCFSVTSTVLGAFSSAVNATDLPQYPDLDTETERPAGTFWLPRSTSVNW